VHFFLYLKKKIDFIEYLTYHCNVIQYHGIFLEAIMIRKWMILLMILFVGNAVLLSAQQSGGFTGPGRHDSRRGQAQLVTVADAKALPDDTSVILQGTIVDSLGDEEYTFRDESGDIVIEIDRRVWNGLSVGANERVEIYGEVDADRRGAEIDVRTINKL
jgi:uncharacterized protein (TIGR00156 family)